MRSLTIKFLRFCLATALAGIAISAVAQTSTAAAPSASAPAAAPSTGTKVGSINVEQAIFGSNEGRRDIEALSKKLEPKQTELKRQNDELEELQKQLQTQGDKLNEDARAGLVKQIETKKKSFDRSVQDAQEEAGNQQQEIANRILQKMAPLVVKYAQDNGFGMIVDTTKPWPQGPVLWYGESVDITKPVVDAYNAQSGVPAPVGGATAPKPAPKATVPKPTGAAKPATKPAEPAK